jgi:hypothetical protein
MSRSEQIASTESRPAALMRCRDRDAFLRDRLYAVERVLAHERIKISSSRYPELWNIDEPGIQPVREHPSEALRVEC